MRKPIQIAAVPSSDTEGAYQTNAETLYALCDDGSIWWYVHGDEWSLLPPIPQDGETATTLDGRCEGCGKTVKDCNNRVAGTCGG